MSNYYLNIISKSRFEEAKKNLENRIARYRRASTAARIIAEKFDGVYVTKRIEQKIIEAIPGAKRAYIRQNDYSKSVFIIVCYTDYYSEDGQDEILICNKDNRRLSAESLLKAAARDEAEAMESERVLRRMGDVVARYNKLAEKYAEIYGDLNEIFHDIPHADYTAQRKYESGLTPDQFLESVAM